MAPSFRMHILGIALCLFHLAKVYGSGTSPCDALSSRFLISPDDILVKQDGDAVFICALAAFDNRTHSLTWDVYQNKNGRVTNNYEDNQVIVSTLTFAAVKREDYFVSCTVTVETGPVRCQETKSAWAIVQCFPTNNDIICGKQTPTLRHKENIVILKCSVFSCNPPVDMEFTFGGRRYITDAETRTVGNLRVLTQEIRETHEMLQDNITCVVTSKVVFHKEQLNCLIDPIKITAPTNLSKKNGWLIDDNTSEVSASGLSTNNMTFFVEKSASILTEYLTTESTETPKIHTVQVDHSSSYFYDVINLHMSNTTDPQSAVVTTNKSSEPNGETDSPMSMVNTISIVVAVTVFVIFLISFIVASVFLLIIKLLYKNKSERKNTVQYPNNQVESNLSEFEIDDDQDDGLYEIPIEESDTKNHRFVPVNMVHANETSEKTTWYSVSSDSNLNSGSDTLSVESSLESNFNESEGEIYTRNRASAGVFYDSQEVVHIKV